MNISYLIENLIEELSIRSKEGIPNLQNREHIWILSEILTEWGLGEIKHELLENLLTEKGSVSTSAAKQAKDMGLQHIAFGYYSKNGEKPATHKADKDQIRPVKPGEFEKDAAEVSGEEPKPEKSGDSGEVGEEGETQEPQQNVKGKASFSHAPDIKTKTDKEEKKTTKKIVDTTRIVPEDSSVSDVDDELSDGEIKQMALNFGTKNKEKFKPAPGNVSSMTAEILSGEAKFHLDQNPNMSDDELTLKLYNQIKDTELGKELGSETVSSSGKYAGYNKDLLSMLKSVAKSGRKKWERNQKGIQNLKSQGKLSDPTTTRSYYGHEVSIQKQMELIESLDGPFYTRDGVEVPKDVLLNFIKNSGGGENPSDTSTITVDERGRAMVSFHSDKISLSDIQANSTPNQEAENAKKIVEESDLPPQIKEQANQIISQGQDLLNQKENELEQAANQPARELANGDISQILNDIKSDKGITGKAKVSNKLKSLLSRGKPHSNLLPYLPQQEEPYTEEQLLKAFYEFAGDDNREGEMTSDQLKLLYRSAKQQGYDISANLGKIREESLEIQRNTHRKLNETSITLPNGDSKPLGDYIEAKNIIDKLHIGVIDGESGEGVGKYTGLFDVNMGGVIVEPDQLKTCLNTDNTDDFISHFEVGTPEKEDEVIINRETGQITGRNIFVYAVTKGGKRIKVAYKTQRSKAGESGKLQTTYQWDKETQKCFQSNQ
jgi:hypothetical protein